MLSSSVFPCSRVPVFQLGRAILRRPVFYCRYREYQKLRFSSNLWSWQSGRQNSGYEKMLLLANKYFMPFDCYLLRYRPGALIDEHTDPVTDRKHYRLNIVLREATRGGEFNCREVLYSSRRIKLFRPDRAPHSVSLVEEGTRYVLSLGWVRS